MVFYGFVVVVALVLVGLFVRSPVFRQVRRGHGTGRPPFTSSNDHANDYSSQSGPKVDPLAQPKRREWE
jgi:hypothetical protein